MSPLEFDNNLFFFLLLLWSIPWKIYALWIAVKHNHRGWFIALVLLNTLAILEIFYIFYIAKKSWKEVKETFLRAIGFKK